MYDELLEKGLAQLNLLSERNLSLLDRYIKEIELFNPAYGLVKVKDRRELILKHILDSLAAFDTIYGTIYCGNDNKSVIRRIADVGSGAGLPGIPLAICMSENEFTLIERMGRRAGFLLNTVAALGLSNVRIEEKEMEKSAPAYFDLVVFRAYKPLEKRILKSLLRLLKPGGALAAYKGQRQAVEEEIVGITNETWELFPLKVPFLKDERHLLVLYS